jgi:hypothetical protein
MKRLISLALVLVAWSLFGQSFSRTVAFWGAAQSTSAGAAQPAYSSTVTNLTGYPSLAYFDASFIGLTTNGGTVNWTDLGTNKWDLANSGAQATWPRGGVITLAGSNALSFDGSGVLTSSTYTSSLPHEVAMVIAMTNTVSSGNTFIFDGVNSSYREYLAYLSANTVRASTVSILPDIIPPITNKWMILDIVFAASGTSYIYTNGV